MCLTPDPSDSSKCSKCSAGYYVDTDGICVKTCPSDTTANNDTGVCDVNQSEEPDEDTCEKKGGFCV